MAATSHGIQVVDRERVEAAHPAAGADRPVTTPAGTGTGTGSAGLGTVGILTLLVGAWGGIVPFVGPLFGFNADGTMAWYWNLPHALLWVVPGAAACVAAAMMVGAMPRAVRFGAFSGGVLAVLAGAWFVVGPEAWPVLFRSAGVFAPAGAYKSFLHMIGYSFGPGVLLLVFGALALGMASRRPRAVRAPRPARQPVVTGRPVTA